MQPATGPPIPADQRLVLRPPKLPWPVAHHRITVGQAGSLSSFFIGKKRAPAQRRRALRDAHDAHNLRDPQGVPVSQLTMRVLKMVDIGVSMGKSGMDIAKEAMDVVLVGNTSTIPPAVKDVDIHNILAMSNPSSSALRLQRS
ncbi:hypothetical protein EDB84DRAFT_1561422 [Lactarius hengduanensis]|nr:hypothetical protein EDB84DRAFT_1561422 [Lactarius hengduanensis]